MEGNSDSSKEKVELTVGVKTSKPKVSIKLSSCVREDSDACVARRHKAAAVSDDGPGAVSANMEGTQRGRDEGAAAAQTQMPSTKPKAGTPVAYRHLIDSSEAASLRDQSHLPHLSPRGTGSLENKRQYYQELCLQVKERKQQMERDRSRNTVDELKHNDTMRRSIWGLPGSGAPNYHLGNVKRTNCLYAAGILPQEQIRDRGFRGTPFQRR